MKLVKGTSGLQCKHIPHPLQHDYLGVQISLGTITASLGVAGYPEHGESVEDGMRSADAAMYPAKESGRNRVELAEKIGGNQTVPRASGNRRIPESRTAPRS